jgi:hypothetical protein
MKTRYDKWTDGWCSCDDNKNYYVDIEHKKCHYEHVKPVITGPEMCKSEHR